MPNIKIKNADGEDVYLEAVGSGTELDPYRPVNFTSEYDNGKVPFYQLMDEVGDGSGNANMSVDGSATPVIFKVVPAAGQVIKLARIITSVRDAGSFDSGGWGNNGGVQLPVGLDLRWKRNGAIYDLTKEKVKSVYDLASYSHDLTHFNFGQGDEFITNRFTFTKAGQYLTLDGDAGDELQVIVNDDLTYLVDQRVSAQGYQQ